MLYNYSNDDTRLSNAYMMTYATDQCKLVMSRRMKTAMPLLQFEYLED
jgi:hypothetical protein